MSNECETCGGFTVSSRPKCNNCFQIETRIDEYLKSEKGRVFVEEKLHGPKLHAEVYLEQRILNRNFQERRLQTCAACESQLPCKCEKGPCSIFIQFNHVRRKFDKDPHAICADAILEKLRKADPREVPESIKAITEERRKKLISTQCRRCGNSGGRVYEDGSYSTCGHC